MEPRSFNYLADACGGKLIQGDGSALAKGVSTDSRMVGPGELFVALSGERFDGHHFLDVAVRRGASGVVIDRPEAVPAGFTAAVIQVENTRRSLVRLAKRYRGEFDLPMIGVAGSNGKTTTKELLTSVLRQRFAVLASPASFNNDIGVPLSLLGLESQHQVAVIELGTNHPGELAPLVQLARPGFGVLTSIGREHLEFFGALEGVAQEEGWLAELLPATGTLFLPGECLCAEAIVGRTRARVVRVGVGPENDWRALAMETNGSGCRIAVQAPRAWLSGEYRLNLLGRHQVSNALLALAVGGELGLSGEELQRGLAACTALPHRLESWLARDVRVLDDAYNANADSVLAALETLREFPCVGRRIAVLGDMAEQGTEAPVQHGMVGRKAAELGIDQLFAVGQMAAFVGAGARAGGLTRVLELADIEAAAGALASFVRPGDVVLIKASRRAALERIGERLRCREETVPRSGSRRSSTAGAGR